VPTGGQRVFNNLVTIRGGEIVAQYLKLHLYDAFAAKESTNVQPGGEIPGLIDIAGLKLGLMTCYDLRFPVWSRNQNDYDLALYVANWPAPRSLHWQSLLIARAIEN
ncbi:nitrilase-related carbon-nitrogen hydrolase, partial [Serratia marcescens]|uniref:nitrilase-related carbon-nitrogen hydrolase n=1 Tax=Serratia marcescens TaxID=615 RepID=UPI0023B8422A